MVPGYPCEPHIRKDNLVPCPWCVTIDPAFRMLKLTLRAVQDLPPTERITAEEQASHCMIEKKSAINLLEAFAVSIKHYLRGEDGIYYQYGLLSFPVRDFLTFT